MGKLRKLPSKKSQEAADHPEEIGAGDNELGEEDDFDHFLDTIDDSSNSEDEADPSQDDDAEGDDASDDNDDDDDDDDGDDDEDMEPEEGQGRDLNEDEDESEEEEGEDSDDQDNSADDQAAEEEGEEGIPVQNGIDSAHGSSSEDEVSDGEPENKLSVKKHKQDLQQLKDTDPEFFAFLKENDAELLDFDDSEDDSGSNSEDESVHKPSETLEEASDSEAEEERLDETSKEHKSKVEKFLKKGVVNINVIVHWQCQLSSTRDITVLTDVIDALQCAVKSLSEGEVEVGMKWRVDGSANFNALLRLCIKEIKRFSVRFLCGNNNVTQNENKFDQKPLDVRDKSKNKWTRLRPKIKLYMEIIVQLFKSLGNPDAIAALLRHCLRMSGFWTLLATKCIKLLRSLVNIWSQGEDSCRVLAFLTIIRMVNYNKDAFLLHMFKQMYISYVANCKFTSVNTWPAINFMRSSLVEIYLLDTSLAYSVAFPFIRQLAIHLRNAMSSEQPQDGKQKKAEASRIVYSWQFVHSLHLWADVLAQAGTTEDENLKLLVYPVVQICMGTIKLIPTKKFIPIHFHVVRMLIKLQEKAGVFIPVLPLITEVLRLTDFSSKSASKFSVRPIDLTCCLKANTSESGYLKAVSENAFETMLAYCSAIATDLGFPEIVTPTMMYLKSFLKKQCKNVEVSKKFKLLLEKIELNCKYIQERRNKALEDGSLTLADKKSHKIIQVQMQTTKPHPPILAYADEYFKVNQRVQLKSRKPRMETKEERLIPKPSALKKPSNAASSKANYDFEKVMFDSDSDDSTSHFETKLDSAQETNKRKRKKEPTEKPNSDEEKVNGSSEEETIVKKKKKLKKKKGKANKYLNEEETNAVDEIVDFEFSD